MDFEQMKTVVVESQHRYYPSGLILDERSVRQMKDLIELVELLPTLVKKKGVLFIAEKGKGLTHSVEVAERFSKLLEGNPFELMQSHKGMKFHPVVELLFDACRRKPEAMKIFYEQKTNAKQASDRYNAYDIARALQQIVDLLKLAFSSYVVKAERRFWETQIRKACERVELFLDALAKQEQGQTYNSYSCVHPHHSAADSRVSDILRDKEALISDIEARMGRDVRGVVIRTTFSNEGLRFDLLLVASQSGSPGKLTHDLGQIWHDVTMGAGKMYCLDSMRAKLSFRKVDESADVPMSEHRRRLAVYFGMADSLVRWEVLGLDTLTVVELAKPVGGWPFPPDGRSPLLGGAHLFGGEPARR